MEEGREGGKEGGREGRREALYQPASVKLLLDLLPGNLNAGRAAVYHHTHAPAMGLAKRGDAEELREGKGGREGGREGRG